MKQVLINDFLLGNDLCITEGLEPWLFLLTVKKKITDHHSRLFISLKFKISNLFQFLSMLFIVFQESLKALIGFIDVAGLYYALTQLTHRNISQNHKFQAVGLG